MTSPHTQNFFSFSWSNFSCLPLLEAIFGIKILHFFLWTWLKIVMFFFSFITWVFASIFSTKMEVESKRAKSTVFFLFLFFVTSYDGSVLTDISWFESLKTCHPTHFMPFKNFDSSIFSLRYCKMVGRVRALENLSDQLTGEGMSLFQKKRKGE